MATFEIVTKSTFTNVYLVEAETKEEAEKQILDTENEVDFLQKHEGEVILACEEHNTTWEDFFSHYKKQGFF